MMARTWVALLLLAAFAACSSPPSGEARKLRFAVIPKALHIPVFDYARKGAERVASQLGVEVLWRGPEATDEIRQKEILERSTRADERIATGDAAAVAAAEARTKGNVTQARKGAEKADEAFTEARKNLGRLRRILPLEDAAARDKVAAKLNELDRKQFALLLATAKFFAALAEAGVNIEMISTSEIRISVVVADTQVDAAVNAAHEAFGLNADEVEAVVYGGTGR